VLSPGSGVSFVGEALVHYDEVVAEECATALRAVIRLQPDVRDRLMTVRAPPPSQPRRCGVLTRRLQSLADMFWNYTDHASCATIVSEATAYLVLSAWCCAAGH
jgi:hypothetical protein